MPKRVYRQAYASVRFMGDDLDPLEVTKSLHLPPDIQYRRGEPRISRSRKGKVLEYGSWQGGHWSMSSKEWVDSPRLETHLEWLLAQLEPHSEAIGELLSGDVTGDLFCFSSGISSDPPVVPRSIRERADALALNIELDHYTASEN